MVTHGIGTAVTTAIEAILPQVGRLIIVDNASKDDTRDVLAKLAATHSQIELVLLAENNLGRAQNRGIEAARSGGAQWLLLLDHDSVASSDMVEQLADAYARSPFRDSVGMIAPYLHDAGSAKPPAYLEPWGGIFFRHRTFRHEPVLDDVLTVIASGSLFPLKLVDAIGGMEESFGIDGIDHDFALRAKAAGYRILVVRDAVLEHRQGAAEDHHLLGQRVTTGNHSAARRYTIYRNRLVLWRRYGLSAPGFVTFDMVAMAYDLFRIIAFEQDKLAKLKAIGRGVVDALKGTRREGLF